MKRFFAYIIIGCLIIFPDVAFGQGRIIPCEGANCQACHLKDLLVRVNNFIIMIASMIATGLFMWAGFLMVTAAGNVAKIEKAKGVFSNVAVGIIIMLSGFLVVDTVMNVLVDQRIFNGRPWQEVQCVPQPQATIPAGGGGGASVIPGGGWAVPGAIPAGDNTYGCAGADRQSCVDVSATRVQSCAGCSFGGSCDRVIHPDFARTLEGAGAGWCATSIGIEPGHGSGCHLRGNCIDAKCTDAQGRRVDCTPETARDLQQRFTQAGLRPVYELPPSQQHLVEQFRRAGVCAYVEPRATGAHFSVYHGGSREGAGQFARAGGAAAGCPL